MKKTVLAILFGAFAVATSANASWYAQADLGYSKVSFTNYSDLNKGKLTPSITVGYKYADWRLGVDYTNYGKFSAKETVSTHLGPIQEEISVKIQSLGISAIYDFSLNSEIKPYVGARLATNLVQVRNTRPNFFNDQKKTKLGYGVLAGVNYSLSQNVILNGGVEYNHVSSFEDTKIKQYGLKAGIRFNF